MADDSQAIREKINSMYESLGTITYYEVMGLGSDLDESLIKQEAAKKFRKLAGEWHIDRFSAHNLSNEEREKVQEIFSFINTAHQVLGNADKRAEYDMQLSGANTDIGSLLNAESSFRRGQTMLETGSYKGAHEQFRLAVENNEEDDEYKAHYLYTEYLLIEKDAEGMPKDRKRAEEIFQTLDGLIEKLPKRAWLLAFTGVVALGTNRRRDASFLFSEALQYDSRNIIAQRQQRLLAMRKNQKKGFFEALKEKIGLK